MSEHDANRMMLDTARLRIIDDPLEQTQRMPVADRRGRQHEGRMMHEAARGEGHARAMVNNPAYRNQEIAAGMRDFREHSNGTLRREYRLTAHEIAQQDGFPTDDVQ
jgi:hypothetical protein